jgi:DNA polymerase-3 subunit alpha
MSIDKYDIEWAGALKLDFLGLTTMSIIARCLRMVGMTLDDLYALPLDDEEVLEAFRAADVVGVFQYEGRATRLVTRDVQPRNFTELVDINALSRPGPLFSGTTAEYVDVRHGRKQSEKLHPVVDAITDRTKGQIIYQEQILQILRDVGGFAWTDLNDIRRIIAKKIGEAAFNVSRGNFVEGAKRLHGIDEPLADKMWKLMVTSGTYAFVTAHSTSYTLIGWWCMWLKVHYPLEFFAASLSKTGDDKAFRLMRDAEKHGIKVKPPQLGVSKGTWTPHDGAVVAGWRQIPGIGEKMAKRIEEAQDKTFLLGFHSWNEMLAIDGIGPKKIEVMKAFSLHPDPFGLHRTEKVMASVLAWLKAQEVIPYPTHTGIQVAEIHVKEEYGARAKKKYGQGPRVTYCGIVISVNYQDAVENRRSRTGEEAEDILRDLYRPDLLAYCSVRCMDTSDEEVYLRINRFKFTEMKRKSEGIGEGKDVVVCTGNRIAGFGTPVMVDHLWVIDPEE